jgi:hypothetical protein
LTRAGLRALGLGAILALVGACVSVPPSATFKEPAEIAGTWRGRLSGRSGNAIAGMTITQTGGFTGTMYLDGEDKDFSGAITVVRSGLALYRSTQGSGTVVLQEKDGKRTLRFQPEGGGVVSVFSPAP